MALDTRGIADGFIRGFEAADGYYNRQRAMGLREEDARMRKESHEVGLKSIDQQMQLRESQEQRAQGQYEHGLRAYDDQQKLATQQEKRNQEAHSANMGLKDASTSLHKFRLEHEKRAAFISENMPLIQAKWQDLANGGDDFSVFDAPEIKGSAYDPRRYLDPKLQQAREVIEEGMQNADGIQSFFSDPKAVEAVGAFYEPNVKQVIGTKSADGRVIKNAKLGGVHLAQDISPDIPGDQPGIVMSIDVDYGDGKWVRKPVTENRSSAQDDFVKVIPLEHAMQDLMGQMKYAKMATFTNAYQQRFGSGDNGSNQMDAEMRKALLEIDKAEAKALEAGELTAELQQQYNDIRERITQRYASGSASNNQPNTTQDKAVNPVQQWANDENKQAFLSELSEVMPLDGVPIETIEQIYQDVTQEKRASELEEFLRSTKGMTVEQVRKAAAERGLDSDEQAKAVSQARRNEYLERTPDAIRDLPQAIAEKASQFGANRANLETGKVVPRPF
ncbi:hypothetical protein [Vibrio metschnikovii]|uniref:hypothetical protein n=1 Tax=Vibrio metschnikovii TaxID=28172 RepID=UPI00164BF989|nr:hypothetical protein [Vibrio metschnikovii]MBC5832233.1 hypothetical protein [Vibrio metschnikovii]